MTWMARLAARAAARASTASKYVVKYSAPTASSISIETIGVVRALDVAVVAQLDVDEVLEPGGADALARQGVLLRRDRDRRDAAAELAGGVQGEAAPARADLEHVHARAAARRRSAIRRYLVRWASASDWSGVSKTALE